MNELNRRNFLKTAALFGGVSALAAAPRLVKGEEVKDLPKTASPVEGKEVIRVGIIGSGGRGTGAALDCLAADPAVRIVAIGDAFMDKAEKCLAKLQESEHKDRISATKETLFDGFDNPDKVLAAGVDLVILAAPPGFRPGHLRKAVEAGKHIFTEKPVCVDPVGYRHVLETAELAKQKNLAVVAGTQRRHSVAYNEAIKRIQDGAIGDLVSGNCYWLQEGLWSIEKTPQMSDMEWQMRNWLYFDWTSGDIIVEQHVHNIDVMNWAMGSHPVKAIAMGGRAQRVDPVYGNVYDHFSVEFEYANGARVQSMCRQIEKSSRRVSEFLVGTKGTADPKGIINGPNAWKYEGPETGKDHYVNEHRDLIKSIRDGGTHVNEIQQVADSCLTAILGRTCAYTGQEVSWNWISKASKLDLSPPKYEFVEHAINPVPIPGVTKLV